MTLDSDPAAPLFHRRGDAFVPTAHTRGPWDPGAMHAGAPTALLAQHLAALAAPLRLARLTFEILTSIPIAPVRVDCTVRKPGRNFQLLEATLTGEDGRALVLARAVALAPGTVSGLDAAAAMAPPSRTPVGPEALVPMPFTAQAGAPPEGMHRTGMDIRYEAGSFTERGPALVWMRVARALVDDEAPSPVARVCAAADFGNGVSNVVSFDTHRFVNTDLTITVLREPVGEWVLLDAVTAIDPAGTGLATCGLHDADGPIGRSHQTLFVRDR